MKISKKFTTVTSFSKLLAMALFIALPIATLVLGINIGQGNTTLTDYSINVKKVTSPAPISSSTPIANPTNKDTTVSLNCLPSDLKPSYFVYVEPGNGNKTTIGNKLKSLGAACKGSKLITSSGLEIYFFREDPKFCQATPVEDYQIRKQNQSSEIQKLAKTYEVIEVTCNPDGKQTS